MQGQNTRLGLVFFAVYLGLYGGFVLLNTFSPATMELTPVAGVNLAILYGFGLIIAALLMSFAYGMMCTNPAPTAGGKPEGERPAKPKQGHEEDAS